MEKRIRMNIAPDKKRKSANKKTCERRRANPIADK
jgi:hypothetical protein